MSAPSVVIQPVSPEHETQIRALSAATQRLHEDRLPHIFFDDGAQHEHLLNTIFDPDVPDNIRAIVALKDDVLAGYVLVIPDQADGSEAPVNALIADICVVEAFRGQGIATTLLAHCQTEKEKMGWESLRAQVWQGNDPSYALFKSAGYAAERTDYRLGNPSPPQFSPEKAPQGWLIPLCLLLFALAAAYLLT